MPNGCGQNFCKNSRMAKVNDRALPVIDVQQWDPYDDMPVRRCDLTTTMEVFANG